MPLPRYQVKDWTYVRAPSGVLYVCYPESPIGWASKYSADVLAPGYKKIKCVFSMITAESVLEKIDYLQKHINPEGYKTMTTETQKPFHETALLVSLNIRTFGAQKHDKKASKEVAENNDAEESSVRANKSLVSKTLMEPVTKAVSAIRTFHYDNTLPWLDEGTRILPSANYESYKGEMEKQKDQFDAAVRGFCDKWPEVILDAQKRLGDLFKPDDYPVDIRERFAVTVRFSPLPEAGDFRLPALADLEKAQLAAAHGATMDEAKKNAMRDVYERLASDAKQMAVKLAAYSKDATTGKVSNPFRDSLVENLRDTVALIPRLNFTDDPELERIRALVEQELCNTDAGTLREDSARRAEVAGKAEKIAAEIGEFMG